MASIATACPFYRYEKNHIVYCEYADLHPPDKKARAEIVYAYCGHPDNYKQCPFYKAMINYYERTLCF